MHAAGVNLGIRSRPKEYGLVVNATNCLCDPSTSFIYPLITFSVMLEMPATSAAPLGMRGLVSDSNVPSFLLERRFLRAAPV